MKEAKALLGLQNIEWPFLTDSEDRQIARVSEALRQRDAEIDQLREQVTQLLADNQVIIQCQEDDKAEIAKLREERDYFQRRYEEARCKSLLKD